MRSAHEPTMVVSLFGTRGEAELACRRLQDEKLAPSEYEILAGKHFDDETGMLTAALSEEENSEPAVERLRSLGVPEPQVDLYRRELEQGCVVVVVRAGKRGDRAAEILDECGAKNVNERPVESEATAASQPHEYPFAETRHNVSNEPEPRAPKPR